MYAVIATGGKQYRVSEGDQIEIERVTGEPGEDIEFPDVLFVGSEEGSEADLPKPDKVKVVGKIVDQKKGDKVIVFKFKRRKMYRRKQGHRQLLTSVQIETISSGAAAAEKASAKASRKAAPAKAEKETAQKARASKEGDEE